MQVPTCAFLACAQRAGSLGDPEVPSRFQSKLPWHLWQHQAPPELPATGATSAGSSFARWKWRKGAVSTEGVASAAARRPYTPAQSLGRYTEDCPDRERTRPPCSRYHWVPPDSTPTCDPYPDWTTGGRALRMERRKSHLFRKICTGGRRRAWLCPAEITGWFAKNGRPSGVVMIFSN